MAVADIAAMTIKEERTSSTDEPAGSSMQADPVELEDRILELCAAHPKGVTDEMIMTDQPSIDTVKRMKALQRLLSMVSYLNIVIILKGRGCVGVAYIDC